MAEWQYRIHRIPLLHDAELDNQIDKALQAHTAARMQPRQNAGLEKGADVLEEIWRAADRNTRGANVAPRPGFVRRLRAILTFLKTDVFGVCLCCKATLGLSRLTAEPWTPLCLRCQEAANRDDVEILRSRSRSSTPRALNFVWRWSKFDLERKD
jgi:hypothetical protein